MKEVRHEKNKIIPYSAIKIMANEKEEYSVLNPDTNSDSPSAKSNGVRLVSAKQVINHRTNRDEVIKKVIICLLFSLRNFILELKEGNMTLIKIKARLIS